MEFIASETTALLLLSKQHVSIQTQKRPATSACAQQPSISANRPLKDCAVLKVAERNFFPRQAPAVGRNSVRRCAGLIVFLESYRDAVVAGASSAVQQPHDGAATQLGVKFCN